MSKQITLSGYIEFNMDYEGEYYELLLDDEGLKQNLTLRVSEMINSFPNKMIQVCYWLSDEEKTRDEMIQRTLERLYGLCEVEAYQEDEGSMGSEFTGWMSNHVVNLTFGGHDLKKELRESEGRFMIIDFNIV